MYIRKINVFFLLGLILLIIACTDQKKQQELKIISDELKKILNEIKEIDNSFRNQLIEDLKELKIKTLMYDSKLGDSTIIELSQKGFSKIASNVGNFFIGINDVKEFGNGYKLFLKIGNPYFAKFSDIKITVKWGKKPKFTKEKYDEQDEYQKRKK